MRRISVTDVTLREHGTMEFKEKVECIKALDRLKVDVTELAPVSCKADEIFVKTAASVVKNTVLSLAVALRDGGADEAWEAVKRAPAARLCVDVPVSSVQMEYVAHKKPQAMLEFVKETVARCREKCSDVEFCAQDATRADGEFLRTVIEAAIDAGAGTVSICDTAGVMTPDRFADFITALKRDIPALDGVRLGVKSDNALGLAGACAVAAVGAGIDCIKSSVTGAGAAPMRAVCGIIKAYGEELGIDTGITATEIDRVCARIDSVTGGRAVESEGTDDAAVYSASDGKDVIAHAAEKLGYELGDEDMQSVYDEFIRVTKNKEIGERELDAIIAAVALQVPAAYTLDDYVINSGNVITATATVHLTHDGEKKCGISAGDGPIDAAFRALESVTGRHCELEDFKIDAVTEGGEAIGRAVVKLRYAGRLCSGVGVSTDIVGAAIRAYIGAFNKIAYGEE